MLFIAAYLALGLINALVIALLLTDSVAADTGCSRWKNRWIPTIVALWLPILIVAVCVHAGSSPSKTN